MAVTIGADGFSYTRAPGDALTGDPGEEVGFKMGHQL